MSQAYGRLWERLAQKSFGKRKGTQPAEENELIFAGNANEIRSTNDPGSPLR
jgi:hypothetical protein